MTILNIHDLPITSSDMMNNDHKEFVDIINKLIIMVNDENIEKEKNIDVYLEKLLSHTKQHFSKEEDLMVKYNFPPYMMHKREHDRILKILNDSIIHWKLNRDRKLIEKLVATVLPEWLIQHITTMDSITAQFLAYSEHLNID